MPSRKAYVDKKGRVRPTEHQEQATLFQWAQLYKRGIPALGMLFAIPNQGAARLKNLQTEGVMRGVPDLFLAYPRKLEDAGGDQWCGLFIELKRRYAKPSDTSHEQSLWLQKLYQCGYQVAVCNGAEEAWQEILRYLEIEDPR